MIAMKALSQSFWQRVIVVVGVCLVCGTPTARAQPYEFSSVYDDFILDEARQLIYAPIFDKFRVDVFDLRTLQIVNWIDVGGAVTSIALSPDGRELAVTVYGLGYADDELIFVDLDTQTVRARVKLNAGNSHSMPRLTAYGAPGSLYWYESDGIGYLHVFDTQTNTDSGRSGPEFTVTSPTFAMTPDRTALYILGYAGNVSLIGKFALKSGTADLVATAADPMTPGSLCILPDGSVFLSSGRVLSADLATVLVPSGSLVGTSAACSRSQDRVLMTSISKIVDVAAPTSAVHAALDMRQAVDSARLNAAETELYVAVSPFGLQRFHTEFTQIGLPQILTPNPGIRGRTLQNGQPLGDIALELRYFDGSIWSTRESLTSGTYGVFAFQRGPDLNPGQRLYVRYRNTANTPGRLWELAMPPIPAFTAGGTYWVGDVDIGDVPLTGPAKDAQISLPQVFSWQSRTASPGDTYWVEILDPWDGTPDLMVGPLGYTGAFNMTFLPAEFATGDKYLWMVWVQSPDGAIGLSRDARWVTFLSRGVVANAETRWHWSPPILNLAMDRFTP